MNSVKISELPPMPLPLSICNSRKPLRKVTKVQLPIKNRWKGDKGDYEKELVTVPTIQSIACIKKRERHESYYEHMKLPEMCVRPYREQLIFPILLPFNCKSASVFNSSAVWHWRNPYNSAREFSKWGKNLHKGCIFYLGNNTISKVLNFQNKSNIWMATLKNQSRLEFPWRLKSLSSGWIYVCSSPASELLVSDECEVSRIRWVDSKENGTESSLQRFKEQRLPVKSKH